jgi:hypothetical protein
MTDPKHSDSFSFILYGTDDSVVPDSISPQTGLFPTHRLSKPARIFLAREALSQIL